MIVRLRLIGWFFSVTMALCHKIRTRIASIRERCPSVPCPIFCRWVLFAVLLILVIVTFALQSTMGYILAAIFVLTSSAVGINNCLSEYQRLEGYVIPRRPNWIGRDRPPTPSPRTTPYIMTIGGDTERSYSDTSSETEGNKSFYSSVNSQIPRKNKGGTSTSAAVGLSDTTFIVVKQNEPKPTDNVWVEFFVIHSQLQIKS